MRMRRTAQPGAKVQALYELVRNLAYDQGPGTQLPSMRTLSEQFMTTRATLSEALDLLEADRILYRREREGIFVSPEIFNKIIYILYDMLYFTDTDMTISPFWAILLARIEQEVQRRSLRNRETCYTRLVRPLRDSENSLPEEIRTLLETERVDGVLAIGLNTKEKAWHWPVPCVTFAGNGDCVVRLDGSSFGRQAAQILLRQGCKQPGVWVPYALKYHISPQEFALTDELPTTALTERDEVQSFCQVLKEHRIPVYPELYRESYQPPFHKSLSLQEQGYLLARSVFADKNTASSLIPDGVCITDDMMTDGALIAFSELGIRVGQDIQLVSHANVGSPILFGRTMQMSVLEYDPSQIALEMFSMLDTLMSGQPLQSNVTWLAPRQR